MYWVPPKMQGGVAYKDVHLFFPRRKCAHQGAAPDEVLGAIRMNPIQIWGAPRIYRRSQGSIGDAFTDRALFEQRPKGNEH